jgi:hypothetical protein
MMVDGLADWAKLHKKGSTEAALAAHDNKEEEKVVMRVVCRCMCVRINYAQGG